MDKLPYREFLAMIQERTREADVPYGGSFELTPLCNLDCKMCYVHLQDPSVKHQMGSGVFSRNRAKSSLGSSQ